MNQSGFKAENEYNSESKCQHNTHKTVYFTVYKNIVKNHRMLKTRIQVGGTTPRNNPTILIQVTKGVRAYPWILTKYVWVCKSIHLQITLRVLFIILQFRWILGYFGKFDYFIQPHKCSHILSAQNLIIIIFLILHAGVSPVDGILFHVCWTCVTCISLKSRERCLHYMVWD